MRATQFSLAVQQMGRSDKPGDDDICGEKIGGTIKLSNIVAMTT